MTSWKHIQQLKKAARLISVQQTHVIALFLKVEYNIPWKRCNDRATCGTVRCGLRRLPESSWKDEMNLEERCMRYFLNGVRFWKGASMKFLALGREFIHTSFDCYGSLGFNLRELAELATYNTKQGCLQRYQTEAWVRHGRDGLCRRRFVCRSWVLFSPSVRNRLAAYTVIARI